jgi:hypothetical protein
LAVSGKLWESIFIFLRIQTVGEDLRAVNTDAREHQGGFMRVLARLIGTTIFFATFLGLPLAAQDINVDYNHNFKFNVTKGYSWGKIQVADPLVEPRITAAVDRLLQGYGFKESAKTGEAAVDQGKPTVMIVTVVEGNSPQQYVAFYRGMGNLDWHRGWESGGFSNSARSLRQIHGGTLVIDLYDGATGKLIWRGTAAEGTDSKGSLSQANVDKTVDKVFANFPPKTGGPMVPNQLEVPPSPSSTPLTSPN